MGVHVAGTQHGHTYYLGPLEGTRAPALITLRSRAPAAHVEFWPLQHTIWQIEAGLSYSDMSVESQELIDRLIPEYKGELRENFVKTLQKACSGIRGRIPGLCDVIRALTTRYQQAQETLQRYGNNYEALGQQIVHAVPGTYPNPGPAYWSQLSPRVYARVSGGHIWQETSTIEVRVLPSSGAAPVAANRLAGTAPRNTSYNPAGAADPALSADNDKADVPLGAVITYPDVGAGVQVLGPGLEPGSGTQPSPMTCGATPSPGTVVQLIPTPVAAENSLGTWTASYPVKPYATLGYALTTGNLYGLNPKAAGGVSMTYASYRPSLTISANLRCPGGCPLLNPNAGVVGYPEIIYGFSPWQSLSSSQAPSLQLPISVSNIQQGLWAVASYSLSGATLPPLDVAYDIWITPPTSGCTVSLSDGGRADDYELMVWLDRTDDFPLPWSYLQGQPTLVFLPTWVRGSAQAVRWSLFEGILSGHQFPTLFAIPSEALDAAPVGVNITGILREFGRNFSDLGSLNGDVIQSIEFGSEFKGNTKSPAKAEYTLAIDSYCLASGSTPSSCPGSISTAMKPPQATPAANGGLSVSDQNVISGIITRLRRDATLKTRDISVSVQNGVVTLEGTVATTAQKRRVENIAQTEKGVTLVKSRLVVSGEQPRQPRADGIRSIDFQNFDYASTCFSENGAAEVIHVSEGRAKSQDEEFWADKPVYGDLKGDGQEEAVVLLNCHPSGISANVVSSEIFIFEISQSGPKVLARLPASYWKEERVAGVRVANRQLEVDSLQVANGSQACPEWIATSKLRWNGNRFINAGETRRKNSCF
jgi:hypothetical protein